MNYSYFNEVMLIANKMVGIGCNIEEIKDFLIKRNLNVTDFQMKDFIAHLNEEGV